MSEDKKREWFDEARQRDLACLICNHSYWFARIGDKWYCPHCRSEVHPRNLQEILRKQEARTVAWKAGKGLDAMPGMG